MKGYKSSRKASNGHGNGQARAASKAERFVDCAHKTGSCSWTSVLPAAAEVTHAEKFDAFVGARYAEFYAGKYGCPSLAQGIYFRRLPVECFESIRPERGTAWTAAEFVTRAAELLPDDTSRVNIHGLSVI